MSSDALAIEVVDVGKCFHIYATPRDRLKQFLLPRLRRLARIAPRDHFREFWALRGVSCRVLRGETVGIIGQNGSGKSTLLQVICGTSHPTTGTVRVHGRIAALLELGSGFNHEFTGRENVFMNGALLGLRHEQIQDRFQAIADFADIGPFMDQPVKTYSSGMVVRLAFAVAVHVDPDILVIDEALAVGDERFQRKCFSRMEDIKRGGATILFVSHSGAMVTQLCDRVMLLDGGEKLTEGQPKDVLAQYQRLIYAPSDARRAARTAIREGRGVEAMFDAPPASASPANPSARDTGAQEYFDPGMQSQSSVDYASRGAHISEVSLMTQDGRRVNGLVRGRAYRLRYTVRFDRPGSRVRFGTLIKTVSGIEIAGSASSLSGNEAIQQVPAGAEYEVEFMFLCALNPGTYFLNAGVLGDGDDATETFLHRRVDIAMFRVEAEGVDRASGLVDLQMRSTVQLRTP